MGWIVIFIFIIFGWLLICFLEYLRNFVVDLKFLNLFLDFKVIEIVFLVVLLLILFLIWVLFLLLFL